MTKRGHSIMRFLALAPVIAAAIIVRWQSGIAEVGMDADTTLVAGPRTAATAAPAAFIADMPPLFVSGNKPALRESRAEPELIGIVGRLPDDAEVLLRMPEGATRSIRIGQTIGGWRLLSVSADRAVFSDSDRQIILTLGPLS